MKAWLDYNCGPDGWMIAPTACAASSTTLWPSISSTLRLPQPLFRWCRQPLLDVADGAFVVRDDEPAVRRSAHPH